MPDASVLYRIPNNKQINFMQGNLSTSFEIPFDFNGFIMAPFDDSFPYILLHCNQSTLWNKAPFYLYQHTIENKIANETEYTQLVHDAMQAFEKQPSFLKVVGARCINNQALEANHIFELYNQLCEAYPNAFIYLFTSAETGTWIAASPEILLKKTANTIETYALAGTVYPQNPQWTSKEGEEQAMVTSYILNALKGYCHKIEAEGPQVMNAGPVAHLRTIISAQLNPNVSLHTLTRVLHPTPAVCGIPLENAQQFIKTHENFNRKFYTGFCGYMNQTNAELYVNLRCAELGKNQTLFYVGAGLTVHSNPQKEWVETENKLKTIQQFL